MKHNRQGFTLIELLIVITIIAILASIVFVALDPLTRFQQARNSRRWADASALLSAIKVNQIDNGGFYMATTSNGTSVSNMQTGSFYMVGTATTGCENNCSSLVTGGDGYCVDVSGLVTGGYLGSVPISPNGTGTWDSDTTGYTLKKDTNGIITVQACETEQGTSITDAR